MKTKIIVVYSSHYDDATNRSFDQHIKNTIGSKHEILCFPNFNEFSLTSLYNRALDETNSKDAILCFIHNDIVFKTLNWGRILLAKFNTTGYGIIGLAGTTSMPKSGIWWEDKHTMFGIVEHTDEINTWVSNFSPPIKNIQDVVIVDGVFMAVDPSKTVGFNETFDGFHFYDISFSLDNYLNDVEIGVITTIRILHKSVGQTSPKWDENRMKFVKLYGDDLPLSITPSYDDLNIKPKDTDPKVTVIIPTKNNYEILKNNILSWQFNVLYLNYNIIIADTGSDQEIIDKYTNFITNNVSVIKYDYYNFAKINNDVVTNHVSEDTELIVFCNDDIELLNDALSRCVQIYLEDCRAIGTIGIRLHYENGSVQHCGIDARLDKNGNIGLTHVDLNKTNDYSTHVNYRSIGNTGAFLMINKKLFNFLGQFNENYIECFEDVELNFKCLISGLKNITACDSVAYHLESVSRNKNENKLKNLNKDYYNTLVPFYNENKLILGEFFNVV